MKNTINVERARKKLSQKDLADAVGTTRQTIHSVETEKSEPRLGLALRIARFFGLKIHDIWETEED